MRQDGVVNERMRSAADRSLSWRILAQSTLPLPRHGLSRPLFPTRIAEKRHSGFTVMPVNPPAFTMWDDKEHPATPPHPTRG